MLKRFFFNGEAERERKLEMLDKENNFFDQEDIDNNFENNEPNNQDQNQNQPAQKGTNTSCFTRQGVVTQLTHTDGIIDKAIRFDKVAAGELFCDLNVGCVVEYLIYKNDDVDFNVVKIQKIIDQDWEEQDEQKLQNVVDSLKLVQPTYFNTQLRHIIGCITQRLPTSIEVDTDYGVRTIELDNVSISFIPKTGDQVSLECTVQLDDDYVDKQGEILDVKKVLPTCLETDRKRSVERVFEDFVILSDDAYVLQEDLPSGTSLHLGDVVQVDLIQCKHGKLSRRAIKLKLMEKNFGQVNVNSMSMPNGKRAITIDGEDRLVFVDQWKKHNVTLKLKNNGGRAFALRKVEIVGGADSQISVVEPVSERRIEMNSEISLIFQVYTKFIAETKEFYTLHFDTFQVKRFLTIIVCETPEQEQEARRRILASKHLLVNGRTVRERSRVYAHQVCSSNVTIVPGESAAPRRRFIKLHMDYYDVPQTLCTLILQTRRSDELHDLLHSQYPFLKEPLSAKNYGQRFSLLLHMEEIDVNIQFRNYDRERAHFQRDGEYLSLQVENLAERRPSLVIGDSVNAINPFEAVGGKQCVTFQGIVHKVLFNRIQLKFNASFQQKYNGEDYRLEFHFSRYAFRKQHYATSKIIQTLGEHFMFPTSAPKRGHPQLDLHLKDDVMHLFDDKLPWYNPRLNSIQKRAVFNILRGESIKVPYVIFGPPGTGKTVTVVETILQLVRNLPSSRILIGTPSNSSANLISQRLIDSKVLHPGEFVRLVSHNMVENDNVPPELASYCATVDIGATSDEHDSMIITDSGLKLRCQAKYLGQHRITVSTCTTLGNFIQMDFGGEQFSHLLIDEAGQCTEPETMMPMVLLKRVNSQVILAGDPHQLQAIICSHYAEEYGLNISFLERMLQSAPYSRDVQRYPNSSGYNPHVLTKLLYNYRALPSIMSVYSRLFYDNELVSQLSDKDSREVQLLAELQTIFKSTLEMPRTHGVFFYGIMGENMQESDSPSWYNPAEAREVFLMTIELYRKEVHPDQIGILTPYSKQVKTLRNMFIGADVTMPKIGSVEEFQGQERDIILISTVRSSEASLLSDMRLSLGFVRSSRRMNVAISRARLMMVIFGNPHLLAVDYAWRHLLTFCANNNAYFGCEMPESIRSPEDNDSNQQSEAKQSKTTDLSS